MYCVQKRNLQFNVPLARSCFIPIDISASTTVFWIYCRLNNAAACRSFPVCVKYWLNGCVLSFPDLMFAMRSLFLHLLYTGVRGPCYLINYVFLPLLDAALLGFFCVPSLALLTTLFVFILLYILHLVCCKEKAVFACWELEPCVFLYLFLLF